MRKLRTTLIRVARLTGFLAAVGLATCAQGVRTVRAQAASRALAIGEKMLALDLSTGEHAIVLNGAELRLAVSGSPLSFERVLDRVEQGCRTDADALGADISALGAGALERPPSGHGFPGVGILRDQRGDRGAVVCFAAGEDVGPAALYERLQTFQRTHDLSALGRLRYVAARREGAGSFVSATYYDGALRLDDLFPATGDAPGDDPQEAVRPQGSRRILSVALPSKGTVVRVYESARSMPAEALAAYEVAMTARGFSVLEAAKAQDPSARAFQRGAIDVLVASDRRAGTTTLSIIEMTSTMASAAPAEDAR